MEEQKPTPPLFEDIPDPTGRIAAAVKKLPRGGIVRRSPFCEWIISRRLGGDTPKEISEGLKKFGRQYHIAPSTLYQHLKKAELDMHVPPGVMIAEGYGGNLELDAVREVKIQILSQRQRVNKLVKDEAEKQSTVPTWTDPRVLNEMGLLNDLFRTYKVLTSVPKGKGKAVEDEEVEKLTDDEEAALIDQILDGTLTIPASKLGDHNG